MKYESNIEILVKDAFENFEADVNPNVWARIQSKFPAPKKTVEPKNSYRKPLAAAAALLLITAAVLLVVNKKNNDPVVADKSNAKISSNASPSTGNGAVATNPVPAQQKEKQTNSAANKPVPGSNAASLNNKDNNTASEVNDSNSGVKEEVISQPALKESQKNAVTSNNIVNHTEKQEPKSTENTAVNNSNNTEISASSEKEKPEYFQHKAEEKVAVANGFPLTGYAPLTVSFYNFGTGLHSQWEFNDGSDKKNDKDVMHQFNKAGNYMVYLTAYDASDRLVKDSVKVIVLSKTNSIIAPNSFTPNDDAINDIWRPQTDNLSTIEVQIIDRNTSRLVRKWNALDGGWDGRNMYGEQVPQGVYIYIITATTTEGEVIHQQNTITLIR